MLNRKTLLVSMLALSLVLVVGACKKPPVTTPPEEAPTTPPPVTTPPPEETQEVEPRGFEQPEPEVEVAAPSATEIEGLLRVVYFDFDKYDLGDETRQALRTNAQVLNQNRDVGVLIEGHCDERGTNEYNMALAEKRASAVRQYLASLGISSGRLRIRSWGEERPADPASSEAAWAKNRRAEFKVE